MRLQLFTSPSFDSRAGVGGWGYVQVDGGQAIEKRSGVLRGTTLRACQLTAILQALTSLPVGSKVQFRTVDFWFAHAVNLRLAERLAERLPDGAVRRKASMGKLAELWKQFDEAVQSIDLSAVDVSADGVQTEEDLHFQGVAYLMARAEMEGGTVDNSWQQVYRRSAPVGAEVY